MVVSKKLSDLYVGDYFYNNKTNVQRIAISEQTIFNKY